MVEAYSNFIDSEWRNPETGETFEARTFVNTNEVIAEFQHSSADVVADVVDIFYYYAEKVR